MAIEDLIRKTIIKSHSTKELKESIVDVNPQLKKQVE